MFILTLLLHTDKTVEFLMLVMEGLNIYLQETHHVICMRQNMQRRRFLRLMSDFPFSFIGHFAASK